MSPRALVALLQAMVSLGLSPNPVWTQLCLQAAVRRASQPAFEPHHYGTLMASLHALGIQPPQVWACGRVCVCVGVGEGALRVDVC